MTADVVEAALLFCFISNFSPFEAFPPTPPEALPSPPPTTNPEVAVDAALGPTEENIEGEETVCGDASCGKLS